MDHDYPIMSKPTVRAESGDDFEHIFSSHDDLTYLDVVNSTVKA